MIDLTVAQIAEIVGGRLADITPAEAAAARVTGTVEFDSRGVGPGGLFLALPGARSDGHDFAAAALAAGAVAVLARVFGWAFAIWGVALYWWAGILYAYQVYKLLHDDDRRAPEPHA